MLNFSYCAAKSTEFDTKFISVSIPGPRWIRVHKMSVTQPPYTVRNLVEGSQYEFRVCAENDVGPSAPSEMSEPVSFQEIG